MGLDLPAASRLQQVPADALHATMHLTRRLTRGALANARDSLDHIARSVDDRRQLQSGLATALAPGELGALGTAECLELLASRSVGRLGYLARQWVPDIAPVNYAVSHGDLLIRSDTGPKLHAAERGELVAFEVDDVNRRSRQAACRTARPAAHRRGPRGVGGRCSPSSDALGASADHRKAARGKSAK